MIGLHAPLGSRTSPALDFGVLPPGAAAAAAAKESRRQTGSQKQRQVKGKTFSYM
jgi:hypothetical protein